MKTFKTQTVHFVFSLRSFVSVHVIIEQVMALGMFTNLCLVLLLLVAAALVFRNFTALAQHCVLYGNSVLSTELINAFKLFTVANLS